MHSVVMYLFGNKGHSQNWTRDLSHPKQESYKMNKKNYYTKVRTTNTEVTHTDFDWDA